MHSLKKIPGMNLQLFADGGDGGAGAAGGAGVSAGDAGQQSSGVAAAGQAGASGDAGQQQDPEKAFEQLIKGQYKDQFGKRVEDMFRQRMTGVNRQLQQYGEMQKQFDAAQPIFDILGQKYGVDATDVANLVKLFQEDESLFEQEAMAMGKDVKELMDLRRIQRQNSNLQRQVNQFEQNERDRVARQQAADQARKWQTDAENLKQMYPSFDLDTELQDESFKRMLQNGIPMKAAYTALHADEIMQGAMQFAAQRTEQRVTDSIIAGAGRPSENGTGAQGAASPKVDPKKLSDAEIKMYNERARRGEKITFA